MFFHSLYYLFLWLCWVFIAEWRLASRGYSLVTTPGFLLTVASLVGHRPCSLSSAAVAHSLRCPAADVIFPDQESNPSALHWQAGSLPLDHQGNPALTF